MANTQPTIQTKDTLGDTAVDGLLSGAVAGGLMAIVLIIIGLIGDLSIAETMGRFSPPGSDSPLTGTLAHLAVSAIYGLIFALAVSFLRRFWSDAGRLCWLLGIIYGFILWLGAEFIVIPATGTPLADFPTLHFGLVHLVYGLTLGLLVGRFTNQPLTNNLSKEK